MQIHFSKYHGAGNDFILIDDRNLDFQSYDQKLISQMCHRRFGIGADGLILLQNHSDFDFEMKYYNSDGLEGSMCGNGGRCIVQFAKDLNLIDKSCSFMAVDGLHKAELFEDGIKLSMVNVNGFRKWETHLFLDTGSPHLLIFRDSIDTVDVIKEGRAFRYNKSIAENGCNVNFIEIMAANSIKIRTYERGVEDETWACGTGAIASAMAYVIQSERVEKSCEIEVNAKGGKLKVSFQKENEKFTQIVLSGSAKIIYKGVY